MKSPISTIEHIEVSAPIDRWISWPKKAKTDEEISRRSICDKRNSRELGQTIVFCAFFGYGQRLYRYIEERGKDERWKIDARLWKRNEEYGEGDANRQRFPKGKRKLFPC